MPAPGEPGSETWKDKNNAWQTGGGAFYVTGSYDPVTNITYWGSGNPVPGYDSAYRPGDNLYTESLLAIDAATGKFKWYFQYTPSDNRDYDETGSNILIDGKVNGEDRKLVSHAGRNGFNYTFDRQNGQFLKAVQHVDQSHLDQGHRRQDRQAGRLRSGQGFADLRRARRRQRRQVHAQCLSGQCRGHQLLAGVLQPAHQDGLHPRTGRLRRHHAGRHPPREGQIRRRHLCQSRPHHQRHRHGGSGERRQ